MVDARQPDAQSDARIREAANRTALSRQLSAGSPGNLRSPKAGGDVNGQDCPLCGATQAYIFTSRVLRQYEVAYYHCATYGLVQTESPYWLEEAYSSAIADANTGLVSRNLLIARKLAAILFFCLDRDGRYLDTAGGYGMLTRLMRDIGFDYYWSDPYCENLLAMGFEGRRINGSFAAVTAFEVLEHIRDPIDFVSDCLKKSGSSTLIFSTELFDGAPPAPEEWWYYAFESGQHISFYQRRTREALANKLSLRLYSHGSFHMLTDRPVNRLLFRLLASRLSVLSLVYVRRRMTSRTFSDHLVARAD